MTRPEPSPQLDPVAPGATPDLSDAVARVDGTLPGKDEMRKRVKELGKKMDRLQTALYAEMKHALLVVLQARDGGGKDSTIRRVFAPINPQGCRVTGFKVPSALELSHDYLWRVHREVPPRGMIGVFNRSHYEDVLVVRLHGLVPEEVWRPRYRQINEFERSLVENGVTILKFFLHISREEQRARMLARLDDPRKFWKFNPSDLGEIDRWEDYTAAYQEMLLRTSTPEAPWYVVPADRKLPRDLLISQVVVDALERLDPKFPEPQAGLEEYRKRLA
ncbi:MAG: polyphosphate kinase 2 family protein [Gemmatimonadales bacterium]